VTYPDYPFSSHVFDSNGFRLHYLDEGPRDAEPLVMLHGNPTWSFYYRKLVGELSDRYRCIVPDHMGMGLSEKPRRDRYPYTLHSRIDDLERLLDHLQINQTLTLIVHDWGGMIGMGYAARHFDRIGRLIVLNSAAFHLPATKKMPWRLSVCRRRRLGAILVRGFNTFCRAATSMSVMNRLNSKVKAAYLAPYDSWYNRIAIHRFVQDIPLSPHDPSYNTVSRVEAGLNQLEDCPMLICWGMRDFVFDEHFLNEWILRFPRAQVNRFDHAGHYVLEDAGDEIASLVRQFLAQHTCETGKTQEANLQN